MNTNLVILNGTDAVTTSLAIAEGTRNEHASVMKLVRTYYLDLTEFGEVRFEIRLNQQGSPTEFAILNEQHSTLVLTYMRNSEVVRTFKKALVKAFWEMRNAATTQFHIPKTLPDALRLAADLADQRDVALASLSVAAPKAEALDRIATASGCMNLTSAAKHLQVSPRALIAWLSSNGWIYKRSPTKSWLAYQDKLDSGNLKHKVVTVLRADGSDRVCEQVLVTARGLAVLASLFSNRTVE